MGWPRSRPRDWVPGISKVGAAEEYLLSFPAQGAFAGSDV